VIDQTFDVVQSPRFVAAIGSGSMEVIEGPEHVVALHIESSRNNDLEVSQSGDTITVARPHGREGRSGSTRLRVEVPAGTTVRLSAASAEINVSVRLAYAYIDTASGDVSLSEVENAKVKSASGDLSIRTVTGAVSVRTASGDVKVGLVVDRMDVSTASGSVDVGLARGGLASSASSGDLAIDRYEGSDLDLKSVSGDIRVGLPRGTRLTLDAKSLSGKIVLPKRVPTGSAGEGTQTVRAKMRTISGDIEIRRVE
jgi:DUF4097 and DUF4098 domain-containing protein YvlB